MGHEPFLRVVIRARTEWCREGSEVCYCSSQNADCWNCRRCRGEHLSTQRRPLPRLAKPPPKNIQKDVFNVLIAIKKDSDRLVLSADKSSYAVVMDKHERHVKALYLLNEESTYAVLDSDPTSKTQRKLNKMSLDLKKTCKSGDYTQKIFYSSDGLCPRFCGSPKIRKPGILLRPVVSFFNSPTCAFLVLLRKYRRLLLGILITLCQKFLRICGFLKT